MVANMPLGPPTSVESFDSLFIPPSSLHPASLASPPFLKHRRQIPPMAAAHLP